VTKQSARQFKLPEGGSIQLVSALIMRLIQTSANKFDDDKEKRRNKALEALNGDEDASGSKKLLNGAATIQSEARAEQQAVTAIQELKEVVSPLLDTAKSNASYVVAFIVNRALRSTVRILPFPLVLKFCSHRFIFLPSNEIHTNSLYSEIR
jgi:cohesin loading factor subunit SCC2